MSEMTMVPNRSGVITNGVAGGLVGEGEGKQKEKTKTNSMTRSGIRKEFVVAKDQHLKGINKIRYR